MPEETKKRSILIVDDDDMVRDMYVENFRNAGFKVFEANDGIEGLDVATKERPDVIFTGIIMPRMDGFAMMESLKKVVMTSSIPVVVSSHMGREEDMRKAYQVGAKDFVILNMTPPLEVINRIKSLFGGEGKEYILALDPATKDAAQLAADLGFSKEFKCIECGNDLVIKLKLTDAKERILEAKFMCGNCGWIAK